MTTKVVTRYVVGSFQYEHLTAIFIAVAKKSRAMSAIKTGTAFLLTMTQL